MDINNVVEGRLIWPADEVFLSDLYTAVAGFGRLRLVGALDSVVGVVAGVVAGVVFGVFSSTGVLLAVFAVVVVVLVVIVVVVVVVVVLVVVVGAAHLVLSTRTAPVYSSLPVGDCTDFTTDFKRLMLSTPMPPLPTISE